VRERNDGNRDGIEVASKEKSPPIGISSNRNRREGAERVVIREVKPGTSIQT
jgi:hypothetical protein